MTYLSAKHIAIKKDQDRTYFDENKVIICDGIGEFHDSAMVAEIVIANLTHVENKSQLSPLIERSAAEIKESKIIGGTTLIVGLIENNESFESLNLTFIGNGSIFHLPGDYTELPVSYGESYRPHRFSNLLIPHVDKEGILLRHISHHGKFKELIPSHINLSLTGINGDIILIFSDGISSLEDDFILIDDQKRIWRNQAESVSFILDELHYWLKENAVSMNQTKMNDFLEITLSKLKDAKKLEDDASFGLIITESVLQYYIEHYNA